MSVSVSFCRHVWKTARCYDLWVGKVGILITMATNLKWKEITKHLNRGQKAHDRPDLTVPVFRLKLQKLMTLFRTACFGKIQACLYPTEFQKGGLTHVHILLCKGNQDTTNHIWSNSRRRNLNKQLDPYPELYNIFITNIINGPCGEQNKPHHVW